jgi:hypothetical protein
MNRITLFVAVFLFVAVGFSQAQTQSGYDLYQKALVKERAVGNVEEAIRLYQRVLREFGSNRPLAAKAQLRLGLLYERLGRKAEARQAFQIVLSQHSDQGDVARQAQARLAALAKGGDAANGKSAALSVRQVLTGVDVGPLSRVSHDGNSFFFTDWETGDIAVRDLATGKTRRLTNKGSWLQSSEHGQIPVSSPDGKQVAYCWFGKNSSPELRVVGIDGSQPRVVYHSDEFNWLHPLQWTPDGKQVLTICLRKERETLLQLISVADGSARLLKSFGAYYPTNASLSPDGRSLVYDAPPQEDAASLDIYLMPVEGGREVPLVSHPENDYPLGWTPDGKRVLFASDRAGTIGVWMIQVANGKA